jgi:shikimate kinase
MNIVFTGFMGVGKSKTGKIVAERLKLPFFDTDCLIEKKSGLSINEIFEKFGESYFRNIENEIVKEVSEKKSVVISCGGGVVLNLENIKLLRKDAIVINLYSSPEVIFERLKNETNRPLLKYEDPLNKIKELLLKRKDAYAMCDFSFNTDGKTYCEVADDILKIIKL